MALTISRTIEVKEKNKIGRNDPCSCGSGKKYKKCHLFKEQAYTPQKKIELIENLRDYLEEQSFFQEVVEKELENILGDIDHVEEEHNRVIEALIYEYNYHGQTPFDYFLKNAPLTTEQKTLYASWQQQNVFSFFQINHINLGNSLLLTDIFTKKTHLAYEHLATYNLQENMTILVRLVPFENDWMFSGGFLYPVSPEDISAFHRDFPKMQKTSRLSQLDAVRTIYNWQQPLVNAENQRDKNR